MIRLCLFIMLAALIVLLSAVGCQPADCGKSTVGDQLLNCQDYAFKPAKDGFPWDVSPMGLTGGEISVEQASDGGTDNDAGACAAQPDDDACARCMKSTCCAQALACEEDTACRCLVSCIAAGGTADSCSAPTECDPPDATYGNISACAAPCASECSGAP